MWVFISKSWVIIMTFEAESWEKAGDPKYGPLPFWETCLETNQLSIIRVSITWKAFYHAFEIKTGYHQSIYL